MPIINRQDAQEVEHYVGRFFVAPSAGRAQALRRLFMEKLDFASATGAVSLSKAPKNVALPPLAERIASMEGLHVVYVPLSAPSPDRVRKAEAAAAAKLLADALHGDLLLVMTNPSGRQLHVIYPTFIGATPSLRRMIIERDLLERKLQRTAVQQLSEIYWNWKESGSISQAVDKAFDVEAVTKQFFEQYKRIFDSVMASVVKGFGMSEAEQEAKKLFVQTMFNRLMFIYFLSRKGWLVFNGNNDYLKALWTDAQARDKGRNFYDERLRNLFFAALNNPESRDVRWNNPALYALIGDVPFLNGGLFDQDERDQRKGIEVPNPAVDLILRELFDRFNFTVMESTPFDVEVAVDPEMLGKVFEELVTGRHESGSYYTPRPVVSFMCREALKGYLETQNTGASTEAIAAFVDHKDSAKLTLSSAPKVGEALAKVKVVDPACGSGAYLLGMMQELVELMATLYSAQLSHEAQDLYKLKLRIIEQNLYGADIAPFAVNIAMLRLWLSLAIDYDGPVPPALPNLDFKIVCGDSLLGPDPSPENYGTLFRHRVHQLAGQVAALKDRHMRATGQEKTNLTEEIKGLKDQLRKALAEAAAPEGVVDWRVEFAEVFDQNGGFDVAIANPPYVRANAGFKHLRDDAAAQDKAIKEWLDYRSRLTKSKTYETLYEKWDLYVPFLERSHHLLRDGGEMVLIISDAYNASKYTRASHAFFIANSTVVRVDFCSQIPLFNAGVRNTIVHLRKSSPAPETRPIRVRRWGESPTDFDTNSEELPNESQAAMGSGLFQPSETVSYGHKASDVQLGDICYVSVGMVIHAHERGHKGAFTADDLISARRDPVHPQPFLLGKDIARWRSISHRYIEWGTDRAPSQFRRPTFAELHTTHPKLLARRISGDKVVVSFEDSPIYVDQTVIVFIPWCQLAGVRNRSIDKTAKYGSKSGKDRGDLETISRGFSLKFLLGVMNSTFARRYLRSIAKGDTDILPEEWKQLPIAPATVEGQAAIVALVDDILALYRQHSYPLLPEAQSRLQELEQRIDKRVAELYER